MLLNWLASKTSGSRQTENIVNQILVAARGAAGRRASFLERRREAAMATVRVTENGSGRGGCVQWSRVRPGEPAAFGFLDHVRHVRSVRRVSKQHVFQVRRS